MWNEDLRRKECQCFICGESISYGRDAPAYCERHKDHAKQDDRAIQNMDFDATIRIVCAIFERAREDYIFNIEGQRSDAEVFFRSNWAQVLTNGALHPEAVIRELDRCRYELGQLD